MKDFIKIKLTRKISNDFDSQEILSKTTLWIENLMTLGIYDLTKII